MLNANRWIGGMFSSQVMIMCGEHPSTADCFSDVLKDCRSNGCTIGSCCTTAKFIKSNLHIRNNGSTKIQLQLIHFLSCTQVSAPKLSMKSRSFRLTDVLMIMSKAHQVLMSQTCSMQVTRECLVAFLSIPAVSDSST